MGSLQGHHKQVLCRSKYKSGKKDEEEEKENEVR